MLATPEPGRLGSNPYRRPRISLSGLFVGFIADSSPDSEYPPGGGRLADVTWDQFAVWQCAGEPMSTSALSRTSMGPLPSGATIILITFVRAARTLRGGTSFATSNAGLRA
jgi:hypothetical protein